MLQHPVIRYIALSLSLVFINASALAQFSSGVRPERYNARPQTIIGPFTAPSCALTNAATVLVSAAACATSPTGSGVNLNTITLTQDSVFAFPTGLPTGGNFQFGFLINHGTSTCGGGGTRACTATFASGYSFPASSLANGQPVLSSAGTDYVWCTSEAGSPAVVVDCNASMLAMTATSILAAPALGAVAHTGSASGSPFTVTITTQGSSGVLVLYVLSNGTSGSSPTITSTSPVSLTWALRQSQVSSLNIDYFITEYTAPFSQTLTSEVINVTLSGLSFGTADVFEVKNAPTSSYFDPNGSLPNGVTGSGNPSITTSNANDIIYCAFRSANTAPTVGAGWTQISSADFQLVQYKIVSVVQASTSCPSTDNLLNASIGDAIQ